MKENLVDMWIDPWGYDKTDWYDYAYGNTNKVNKSKHLILRL